MRSRRPAPCREHPSSRRRRTEARAADATGEMQRKAESFLMWLLGWALAGGGAYLTLIFVLGVRPKSGPSDLPCYIVYVGLHLLVVSAGVKVLGHRRAFRRAARALATGRPDGLIGMVRETGLHYVGFVASIVAAWGLLFFFCRWPFRLTHVDLALTEVHSLRAVRYGYASAAARLDAAFVVNLVLMFAAFELAVVLRRFLVSRRLAGGTAAAGAAAVALFVLFFPAYAKVRGFCRSRGLSKRPNEVVIRYHESPGSRAGDFVIAGEAAPYPSEDAGTLCVPSSEMQMLELLEILADGGFFEMEGVLYPYGTIDGMWKSLEVTGGEVRHCVRSYHGTAQDRRFDALVGRLMQAMDLQLP